MLKDALEDAFQSRNRATILGIDRRGIILYDDAIPKHQNDDGKRENTRPYNTICRINTEAKKVSKIILTRKIFCYIICHRKIICKLTMTVAEGSAWKRSI